MTEQHELPLDEYHRAGREITNGNREVYKAALLAQQNRFAGERSRLRLVHRNGSSGAVGDRQELPVDAKAGEFQIGAAHPQLAKPGTGRCSRQ